MITPAVMKAPASSGECVGIGGHNFLPPEDSAVAAAVLVSPGGPAHVMLTDTEAEPGPIPSPLIVCTVRWADL